MHLIVSFWTGQTYAEILIKGEANSSIYRGDCINVFSDGYAFRPYQIDGKKPNSALLRNTSLLLKPDVYIILIFTINISSKKMFIYIILLLKNNPGYFISF